MALRDFGQQRVRLVVPRLNTLLRHPSTSCSHSLADMGIARQISLTERHGGIRLKEGGKSFKVTRIVRIRIR